MSSYIGNSFLSDKCYFYNLQDKATKDSRIYLPSAPEQISVSVRADWPQQQMVGRSAPITTYTGTSFREISFSISLHKDLCDDLYGINSYEKIINGLYNCVYPNYGKNPGDYRQPRSRFVFGAMHIDGAVTNLGLNWKKPLIPVSQTSSKYGFKPIYSNVEINVSFVEIIKNVPSYGSVNRGDYFWDNGATSSDLW
jgi:hypothetical protein